MYATKCAIYIEFELTREVKPQDSFLQNIPGNLKADQMSCFSFLEVSSILRLLFLMENTSIFHIALGS